MSAPLPRNRGCARAARQLLKQCAADDTSPRELEDAALIVSELATNALLHGQGSILLSLRRFDDRLRLEVCNDGSSPDFGVVAEEERGVGGRGLWLVAKLAVEWGVTGRTCVWAELALSGP